MKWQLSDEYRHVMKMPVSPVNEKELLKRTYYIGHNELMSSNNISEKSTLTEEIECHNLLVRQIILCHIYSKIDYVFATWEFDSYDEYRDALHV